MTHAAGGANGIRRLALNAERLAELSTDELRVVNGGATLAGVCPTIGQPRDPSELFVSVCGCLTHYCPTRGCT